MIREQKKASDALAKIKSAEAALAEIFRLDGVSSEAWDEIKTALAHVQSAREFQQDYYYRKYLRR